jgi:phosphonate ABC transporter permease subunit PhnE
MQKKKPSLLRSLGIGFSVIVVIIIYAYGFQVTDVNFEMTRSEDRLTQLRRVLRALVKPDIIEYDQEEIDVDAPFYLPCPEGQDVEITTPDMDGPYLLLSENCASPKEIITVEGFNITPNSRGPINFVAASGAKRQLANFQTDSSGYFSTDIEIPNRQPVVEAQYIRATARIPVGSPKLTGTALATWDKIIETVFIALLATTIGTIASIPISFVAARNLMSEVKSPLSSISFSLVGWPIGIGLGILVARWMNEILSPYLEGFVIPLVGVILGTAIILILVRWSMPAEDVGPQNAQQRAIRSLAIVVIAVLGIGLFILLGGLVRTIGLALVEPLGSFGFLGNLIFQFGEIINLLISVVAGLVGGAVVGGALSKIGQAISDNLSPGIVKSINMVTTALAGAILFALVGAGIDWFYQINNYAKTLYWPAGIGGVIGLAIAAWASPKRALPTGMIVYFIARTILNGTRSVEPLVMAIVFVIWVGIGPFAGSLALALHTIAALAKLYSEQVESILPGPLEAVTATGANRIQTIVYAVIPQIVPPYISFTMYRWDINVRMSTIIGFVGGGGIGFLLQQNINLLNYRAASVQMLAIAVVVAIMDYVSSSIRERIV